MPSFIEVPTKTLKYSITSKDVIADSMMKIMTRINVAFIASYAEGILVDGDNNEHPYTHIRVGGEWIVAHLTIEEFEDKLMELKEKLKEDELKGYSL